MSTIDLSGKDIKTVDPRLWEMYRDAIETSVDPTNPTPLTLDLSYNRIQSFGTTIVPLDRIQRVVLSHNRIVSLLECFPLRTWGLDDDDEDSLNNNHAVEALDLSHNAIQSIVGKHHHLPSTLSYLFLRYLDLSNNNLMYTDVSHPFCSALLPHVTTLIFDGNQLERIPYDLPPELHVLSLKYNALSNWADVKHLTVVAESLEVLNLADNPLMDDVGCNVFLKSYLLWLCPMLHTMDGEDVTESHDASLAAKYLFRSNSTSGSPLEPSYIAFMDEGREEELQSYLQSIVIQANAMMMSSTRTSPQQQQHDEYGHNVVLQQPTDGDNTALTVEVQVLRSKIKILHDTVFRLFQSDLRRRESAAKIIQKHYKGYRVRRSILDTDDTFFTTPSPLKLLLRQHRRLQDRSALRIQRVFKGYLARVGYAKLQEAWRPYKDNFARRVAVLLQRCGRGLGVRRRVCISHGLMVARSLASEVRGLQGMILRLLRQQPKPGGVLSTTASSHQLLTAAFDSVLPPPPTTPPIQHQQPSFVLPPHSPAAKSVLSTANNSAIADSPESVFC